MSILVTLEGVLRSETGTPIPEGVRLVETARSIGRLVLLAPGPRAEAEHWLRVHGIKAPADLLDDSVTLHDGDNLGERQVVIARARGPVDFLIAAAPSLVAFAISRGITGVLFSHPVLTSPKFRPDRERRSWQEIVDTLERQVEHAATKTDDGDWGHE